MNGSRLSSPAGLPSLTDAETTIRVPIDRDTHAFAVLVERWERPVKLLCARMTGDAHRAEDLAQETFTRLFLHRDRYRDRARPSTLLWRIAFNLCCDERRSSMRRRTVSIDGDPAAADNVMAVLLPPEARLIHRERADLVRSALSRLPSPSSSTVTMTDAGITRSPGYSRSPRAPSSPESLADFRASRVS